MEHLVKLDSAIASPSPRVRRIVTMLLAGHLAAIALAVTSYSTANFPAPQLAVAAAGPVQPYLQATFLNNAYRFFAPNPGTPTHFWVRLQYDDGAVRWAELPGAPDSVLVRASYQRRLNLALLLGAQLVPDPAADGAPRFTPLGEACLASVLRRVCHDVQWSNREGTTPPIRTVGVYVVQHAVVTPQQVREGWTPSDLRTYQPVFVGVFDAEGQRKDDARPAIVQPIARVVAGILWADVYPVLRRKSAGAALDSLSLPPPIDRFLRERADLLDSASPTETLEARIEQRIGSVR